MSIAIATTSSTAATDFRIGTAVSRDGTTIGYRHVGDGPGLILLHGSMSSGAHHTDLARLLAGTFTVFVPDRRGRGLSGPYGNGNPLAEELEDVAALLHATGARYVWGLSSGADLALQAARTMTEIERLAVYEPAILPDRAQAAKILETFDTEMARGRIGDAMVTAMRGAEMGPRLMRALPKALLARIVRMGMAQEAKKPAGPYPSMAELAPTLHSDFTIATASSGRLDDWRQIRADVLLMGGSRSPAFLKRALADLDRVLPGARRVELAGLDHAASWNRDLRGNPEPVGEELLRYFGSR